MQQRRCTSTKHVYDKTSFSTLLPTHTPTLHPSNTYTHTEEGRVDELRQLLSSGAVKSLKVVDSDGAHVLNLAIQAKQDKVVQVRG